MTRKPGWIALLALCGAVAVEGAALAQAFLPEDDDGYDQYRAEPERRPQPQIPSTKPFVPQRPQVLAPDRRTPDRRTDGESTDPLNPNRPQALPQRQAQPSRPPLAQDPSIMSDQVEREPDPPPPVPPRRPTRTQVPLEPVMPPAGENDPAYPPPEAPTGYYPPPVYYPTKVYSYAAPRYYPPPYYAPQYYGMRPYGYYPRPYYPAEVYIYAQRNWRR